MDPNSEKPISEEAQAARGMEVKKTVRSRLEAHRQKVLKENPVARDWKIAIDKISATARDGSLRQKIFEKVRPALETVAYTRGLMAEKNKFGVKVLGIVGSVIALLSPEPTSKLLGGAIAIGATAVDKFKLTNIPERMFAKTVQFQNEMARRSGVPQRIDAIADGILLKKNKT